jgi:ankyrin repeat protein
VKYLKSYNESLRDKMKPKSDEDILKELGDLSPENILLQSAENNYIKGVKIALDKGADINYKDNIGWTALLHATFYGYKDIVELLLKNGADINIKNNGGNTALIIASKFNHKNIIKLLLKNGADVNIKNKYGNTALNYNGKKYIYIIKNNFLK